MWLGEQLQSGIKCPNEIVCDYSRAILDAVSRAFCNSSSLTAYIENCFMTLTGQKDRLPCCYIRVDVAHIIQIFCRIKCLIGIKNKMLKEFYVRALGLILSSETLTEFGSILEALLIVTLSETEGWTDEKNPNKTKKVEKYC